jgi:methanogenic corrinoid protein MtbC1
MEFLEATNRRLVDPSAIGLDPTDLVFGHGSSMRQKQSLVTEEPAMLTQFEKALLAGDESTCRKIVSNWFAMHGGITSLADNLLSAAFKSIGDRWQCGTVEIYQERRGCEICCQLIHELRRLLPEPPGNAPLAMGGTASGDQYQLPNQLAEIVFRENGWRTISLGTNIPFASLLSAARKHMPKVFWLSVSHIENIEQFVVDYNHFAKNLPKGVMLVLGGQALNEQVRPSLSYSAHCDSMLQLANLARSARGSLQPKAGHI